MMVLYCHLYFIFQWRFQSNETLQEIELDCGCVKHVFDSPYADFLRHSKITKKIRDFFNSDLLFTLLLFGNEEQKKTSSDVIICNIYHQLTPFNKADSAENTSVM